MVNWLPIVPALLGIAPAAAIFFVAYGRYDGAFRDNVVFLYFMGGLLGGGFLGFLALLLYSTNAILAQVLAIALLLPLTILVSINRRKWQGERHAVFNGGAFGLGVAVMMSFSFVYFRMRQPWAVAQAAAVKLWEEGGKVGKAPEVATAAFAFDPTLLGQGLLLAAAFAGLLFGFGLLMGDAVRRRVQLKAAFAGAAIAIAPSVLLEEFVHDGVWLWLVLLVGYGAVFAIAADRKLLIQGVDEVARKARRRARRKGA